MATLTMELRNAERAMNRIVRAIDSSFGQSRRFVHRGTQMLLDTAQSYTRLADHTLDDLRRLDHPYARRFGPGMLHPDFLVHAQSGTLTAGLHARVDETVYAITGTVKNDTYYDKFVQRGTVRMRPRPYMHQTRADLEPILVDMARNLLRDIAVTLRGP